MSLKVKYRILLGVGTLVVMLLILSVSSYQALTVVKSSIETVTEKTTPLVVLSGQLTSQLLKINRSIEQISKTESKSDIDKVNAKIENQFSIANTILGKIKNNIGQSSDLTQLFTKLSSHIEEIDSYQRQLLQLQTVSFSYQNTIAERKGDFESSLSDLNPLIENALEEYQGEIDIIKSLYLVQNNISEVGDNLLKLSFTQDKTLSGKVNNATESTLTNVSQGLLYLEEEMDGFEYSEISDIVDTIKTDITEDHGLLSTLNKLIKNREDTHSIGKDVYSTINISLEEAEILIKSGQKLNNAAKKESDGVVSNGIITLVIVALTAFAFAVGVAIWLINGIQNPLNTTISALSHIADGDLTHTLKADSQDEFGELATSVNKVVIDLKDIIEQIIQIANSVNHTASNTEDGSKKTQETISRQREQTDMLAAAMQELSQTANNIAQNAEMTLIEVNGANQSASNGGGILQQGIVSMEKLTSQINTAVDTVSHLEKNVDSISSILDVIRGIAEQTNLLALNAAIEAARAGEQGRGFAVVADEVRNLASRTQESTLEIQTMIENLQAGSRNAVEAMQQSTEEGERTSEKVRQSGDSFHEISEQMGKVIDMSTLIASAAEQQSATTDEMATNMESIAKTSDDNNSLANENLDNCRELNTLAENLTVAMQRFKV